MCHDSRESESLRSKYVRKPRFFAGKLQMEESFRLQDFVNTYPPDQILSEDEYDHIYKYVENQVKDKGVEVYVGTRRPSPSFLPFSSVIIENVALLVC